jgi:hypothetical protein
LCILHFCLYFFNVAGCVGVCGFFDGHSLCHASLTFFLFVAFSIVTVSCQLDLLPACMAAAGLEREDGH